MVKLSGTEFRRRLRAGEDIPEFLGLMQRCWVVGASAPERRLAEAVSVCIHGSMYVGLFASANV